MAAGLEFGKCQATKREDWDNDSGKRSEEIDVT